MKKQSKTKAVKKPLLAKTLKAAASLSKLPVHVIQNAKSSGCQAFKTNGTVDVEALLDWVCEHPMPAQDDIPNLFVEKALDARASRRLKEQKLLERQRLVVPLEEVRRVWTANSMRAKFLIYDSVAQIAGQAALHFGFSQVQSDKLREIVKTHQHRAVVEIWKGDLCKVECPKCRQEIECPPRDYENQKK